MSGSVLPWIASGLVLSGALFCLLGAIGVLRLPDCYSRMHAASKAGALGAALVLGGVAAASSGEVAIEALFALLVLLGTAPLAAHAISRAASRAGIRPIVGPLGNAMDETRSDVPDTVTGEAMMRARPDAASSAAPAASRGVESTAEASSASRDGISHEEAGPDAARPSGEDPSAGRG